MIDIRIYRGVDVGSDYNFVFVKIKFKLCRVIRLKGMWKRYDVSKLKNLEIRKEFVLEFRNRFSCLIEEEIENVDDILDNGNDNSIE